MMRTNAAVGGEGLLPAIAEAGKAAAASDVVALLRDPWRSTVMGAWLALLFPCVEVRDALRHALTSSHGSLDAPPLATASVILLGDDAVGALQDYSASDVANGWGACGFVAAAIERLGVVPSVCSPSDTDRQEFAVMFKLAERLHGLR